MTLSDEYLLIMTRSRAIRTEFPGLLRSQVIEGRNMLRYQSDRAMANQWL
jgi:hypothetical protein